MIYDDTLVRIYKDGKMVFEGMFEEFEYDGSLSYNPETNSYDLENGYTMVEI